MQEADLRQRYSLHKASMPFIVLLGEAVRMQMSCDVLMGMGARIMTPEYRLFTE